MRLISFFLFAIALVLSSGPALDPSVLTLNDSATWTQYSAAQDNTEIRASPSHGGDFDLLGDGALLLQKQDPTGSFVHQEAFRRSGRWASPWMAADYGESLHLSVNLYVYGEAQDMSIGWTKLSGNPLVAPERWRHTTPRTLATPTSPWTAEHFTSPANVLWASHTRSFP